MNPTQTTTMTMKATDRAIQCFRIYSHLWPTSRQAAKEMKSETFCFEFPFLNSQQTGRAKLVCIVFLHQFVSQRSQSQQRTRSFRKCALASRFSASLVSFLIWSPEMRLSRPSNLDRN